MYRYKIINTVLGTCSYEWSRRSPEQIKEDGLKDKTYGLILYTLLYRIRLTRLFILCSPIKFGGEPDQIYTK